jgi:hypothetical protein
MERLPVLGCQADWQRIEVSLIGCLAVKASNGAVARCTTRRRNAHRTEERKVLYLWHPGAGCIVHIHEVIEKVACDVARCSHDGASGRLLELPIWMFDRSACARMRVETFPRVDTAALQALRVLLDATAIEGVAVGLASSNARVSGAARFSHDQNRGEAHATPTAASTRPSKRDAAVRFVLLWFHEQGLDLPTRRNNGDVTWRRPSYATIHRMVDNPIYGGAYAYGKTCVATGYDGSGIRVKSRRKPRVAGSDARRP